MNQRLPLQDITSGRRVAALAGLSLAVGWGVLDVVVLFRQRSTVLAVPPGWPVPDDPTVWNWGQVAWCVACLVATFGLVWAMVRVWRGRVHPHAWVPVACQLVVLAFGTWVALSFQPSIA